MDRAKVHKAPAGPGSPEPSALSTRLQEKALRIIDLATTGDHSIGPRFVGRAIMSLRNGGVRHNAATSYGPRESIGWGVTQLRSMGCLFF